MSCDDCRKSRAPVTPESALRRRAITASSLNFRCDVGLSSENRNPEFVAPPPGPPPPVKATTCATAGSRVTVFTICSILPCIAWKEMLWSARTKPISEPELCCGKNPFGTTAKR